MVTGHEHHYERFAMMNKKGPAVDYGRREFVVGKGELTTTALDQSYRLIVPGMPIHMAF